LAPFASGFVEELGRRGYSPVSVVAQMQLVAHLSRWMAAHKVAPDELTIAHVERFIRARRGAGYRHFLSVSSLSALLDYLGELGVMPAPAAVANAGPADLLLARYREYLVAERALAAATVRLYEGVARRFLAAVSGRAGELDLAGLTAGEVSRFVLEECGRVSPGSAGNAVVALRSLLRFLHIEGLTRGGLAAAVPAVAPRPRGLPRALPAGAVARLLGSCDRRTGKGRRDLAVLIVLSRLGLRAGEVSAIELGDVDWRAGELLVRGKAGRRERMPLPVDVGEALAGYLQRGRPRGRLRAAVHAHGRADRAADQRRDQRDRSPRVPALRAAGRRRARAAPHRRDRDAARRRVAGGDRPAAAPADRVHHGDLRARGPRGACRAGASVAGGAAMSALRQACEDYLALRRALGFKLERPGRILPDLVAHLEASGQTAITTRAALEWATRPAGHPQECADRLSIARGFARHLRALDGTSEVPPTDLLPGCRRRLAPHIYSDRDIAALMAATATIHSPFRAATHRTLIGLLAVTGMRIGEAIALDQGDVDLAAGCVTVRAGKWNAARELPLHDTTVRALDEYRKLRERRRPTPTSPAFFVSMRGTRLLSGHVREAFRELRRHADVTAMPGARQPRIHDVRHSFAVATLVDWYRADADVAARLPRLSSYLGHSAPEATYYYLQATPQLLALAAERLERIEERRS